MHNQYPEQKFHRLLLRTLNMHFQFLHSIEYLNSIGRTHIQPREMSFLNNIDVFIWYHWCPVKRDIVIHALKEPRQLFQILQVEKEKYTERIAGKPLRYGDEDKKVDVLYINPAAKNFSLEKNLILIYNPFVQ